MCVCVCVNVGLEWVNEWVGEYGVSTGGVSECECVCVCVCVQVPAL